jgi:hypothetical protein
MQNNNSREQFVLPTQQLLSVDLLSTLPSSFVFFGSLLRPEGLLL